MDVRLKVFYDGACYLCSHEMEGLRKKDKHHKLEFVDIADPSFNAGSYHLDPVKVQQVMHVQLPNGEIRTAIDALVEIWKRFPEYKWRVHWLKKRWFYRIAHVLYRAFAKGRVYLPKRKRSCHSGICYR